MSKENITYPFYFGGLASCTAAICTHPLDTIKVRLQVLQQNKGIKAPNFLKMGGLIIYNEGIFALYNGLSASILRQITYSTARFAAYEFLKEQPLFKPKPGETLPLLTKISLASLAGAIGGIVGCPADLTNVRMQADGRLPVEQRRNYKSAFHGLYHITRDEGVKTLWRGATPMVVRGMLMNAGQLASYDQFKELLLKTGYFKDDMLTYFVASFLSGIVATFVTMPLDVVKTRLMNSPPGFYKGPLHCFTKTIADEGPLSMFRGFTPAFIRLGPHTIITFLALEKFKELYRKYH